MDMTFRAATFTEQLYVYSQHTQIAGQCGSMGCLSGGLNPDNKNIQSHWDRHMYAPNAEKFQKEFDSVIHQLRTDEQYGGVMKNYAAMLSCCLSHPEAEVGGSREYAFRADTQDYAYLLRCVPKDGEKHIYLYPYRRDWLDKHMKNAERGIRFITPDYREKFRLQDGEKIRIIMDDGKYFDHTARYIDDCHLALTFSIYHICELAERLERGGSKVIPLRSSLPDHCYSLLSESNAIIIITKGESGYQYANKSGHDPAEAQSIVDECNKSSGVTKAQEAAMLAGSMYGWDVPAADPKHYDKNGDPVKQRHSRKNMERGDAR